MHKLEEFRQISLRCQQRDNNLFKRCRLKIQNTVIICSLSIDASDDQIVAQKLLRVRKALSTGGNNRTRISALTVSK